jgi:hypothetical protein
VNVIVAYNDGYGISNDSSAYEPELAYGNVYGNDDGEYDGVSDPTGADGNLSEDPGFLVYDAATPSTLWDLHLATDSTLVDAGDPSLSEPDGSISDIGAFGGPGGISGYSDDADGDGMPDGWEDAHGLDSSLDDSADDLDGDGLSNLGEYQATTDPENAHTDQDVYTDGEEVSSGDDPLTTGDSMNVWLRGPSDYAADYGLGPGGDVDGDGNEDMLVCMQQERDYASATYVFYGPLSSDGTPSALAAGKLVGEASGDTACAIDGAGDMDGDGYGDVVVGAYAHDEGGDSAGAAYLVLGPVDGTVALGDARVKQSGSDSNTYMGWRVRGGMDLDGDGVPDLAAAMPYDAANGANSGAVGILLGSSL